MSELDYTALSLIFTRYYRRLVQYCTGYLGSYDEAEDIVQDAFVRVWEKRNSLRSEAIGALLFTMVRNSCLNSLKHRAVVDKFEAEFTPPYGSERLAAVEDVYSFDFLGTHSRESLYEELHAQVEREIAALPERCREVFLLSRRDSLSNREIAARLGISEAAVHKNIDRALGKLSAKFRK